MDSTRPRWICTLCGAIEYCDSDKHMRFEFPPDAAKRALGARHVKLSCEGHFKYRIGLGPGLARVIRGE